MIKCLSIYILNQSLFNCSNKNRLDDKQTESCFYLYDKNIDINSSKNFFLFKRINLNFFFGMRLSKRIKKPTLFWKKFYLKVGFKWTKMLGLDWNFHCLHSLTWGQNESLPLLPVFLFAPFENLTSVKIASYGFYTLPLMGI